MNKGIVFGIIGAVVGVGSIIITKKQHDKDIRQMEEFTQKVKDDVEKVTQWVNNPTKEA